MLLLVFANITDDPDRGWQETADLVTGQYGLSIDKLARWIHVGPADKVAAELDRYRAAGADGFVVLPMAHDVLPQIEAIAAMRAALGG